MRVLVYFGGRLEVSRGTPSRARNMVRALALKPGVEVSVLSRDSKLDRLDVHHWCTAEVSLAEAVDRFRPTVVYGHTHKALPAMAPLSGCLRVVDLHGDPVAEKLAETHRPWPRRLQSAASLWLTERRFTGRMDGLTVVSRFLARRIEHFGVPTRVVWGGVDPTLFSASAGDGGETLVIGYAGNFRPYQGLPTLIEAAGRLAAGRADLRLLLIGDPGSSGVDRLAERKLPGRVELTGQLQYEEVPKALARANVLVIPRPDSRTARAGFPSKLPEYMALGKALVVTDVGEQGRAVRHEESGLVVPPDDPAALAAALDRLRQAELRDRLGRAARAAAESNLNWNTIADELVQFFTQVEA